MIAILKLVLTSSLLAVGGTLFPFLFLFFPVLFTTEAIKQGIVRVMATFLGVCVIFGLVLSPGAGVILFALFGPLIMTLDYCIRSRQNVDVTMVASSLILLASIVFVLYISGTLASIQDGSLVEALLANQKALLEATDFEPGQVSDLLANARVALNFFHSMLPSIILLTALLIVYVSYSLTGRRLLAQGELIKQPSSFIFFSHPRQPIFFGFVTVLALYLLGTLSALEVELIQNNLLFTLTALISFQGLSVVAYYLTRWIKVRLVRSILLVVVFLIPGIQMGLAFLGLIDQVFNLRRLPGQRR
ncbi:MAG: DUF2232 domain-containing protein [Tissierellia bacterium]|nr:DUF2232 domain-containing protein [Tissierellia bacterium]